MILICHITSDQNLEETRNKKCIFPTMTKWTTSGQTNLKGTRAEERFIVAKNHQQRWWVWFSFLNYYTAKPMTKGDLECCHRCNVLYHEICVGA